MQRELRQRRRLIGKIHYRANTPINLVSVNGTAKLQGTQTLVAKRIHQANRGGGKEEERRERSIVARSGMV